MHNLKKDPVTLTTGLFPSGNMHLKKKEKHDSSFENGEPDKNIIADHYLM